MREIQQLRSLILERESKVSPRDTIVKDDRNGFLGNGFLGVRIYILNPNPKKNDVLRKDF